MIPTTSYTDSQGWVERLRAVDLPVLRASREAIEHWRGLSDRVDANFLADIILQDPLLSLRVMVHVTQRLGARLDTPVETVTSALVLLGIEPFFRDFRNVPVFEDRLAGQPQLLDDALAAVACSGRAARLAAAFAIHRQDEDAEVLHQAALLENCADLLLWHEAPLKMMEIGQRLRMDAHQERAALERVVLGVPTDYLARCLFDAWGLARFPLSPAHDGSHEPQSHTVMLAARLARHLGEGADNPHLPHDYEELAHLLNVSPAAAAELVQQVES